MVKAQDPSIWDHGYPHLHASFLSGLGAVVDVLTSPNLRLLSNSRPFFIISKILKLISPPCLVHSSTFFTAHLHIGQELFLSNQRAAQDL